MNRVLAKLWVFTMAMIMSSVFVLAACPPPPLPPTPDADSGIVIVDADAGPDSGVAVVPSCTTWCAHAIELRCPAAEPTRSGAKCTDVCANTLDGPLPFDVACRTRASTCAAADECENRTARAVRDGGPLATAPATCAAWCKHADALRCSAAKPTGEGASCVQVCENVQSGKVKWNLACRIAAKTCTAADACKPLP